MKLVKGDISLREFRYDDAQKITQICNNKKVWDNVRDLMPFPYNETDAEKFIANCQNEYPQTTFIIEFNGEVAGTIGLVKKYDVYRNTAELGYLIGEHFWGKGIATTAVKLICDYAFNSLNLIRIESSVFDFNKASQRVLEKNDFKLDCVAKNSVVKNNKIGDEYRYYKLK